MFNRRLLILLTILSFTCCLDAQQNVTVLSATGGAGYRLAGQPEASVYAGARLSTAGQLDISENSTVSLIVDGRKLTLEGPETVQLHELRQRLEEKGSPGFLGRFWNFISNSVSDTQDAEDVEKYHRRYMTNTRAGIAGYVDRETTLKLPLYYGQILTEDSLHIRWTELGKAEYYHLRLEDAQSEEPILITRTKTPSFDLSITELDLQTAASYLLRVTATTADTTVESPTLYLSYEPESLAEFIQLIEARRAYQKIEALYRPVYLYRAMEESRYFQAAHRGFQQLMIDNPKNQLFRKLYAAFLVRMDDPEAARLLVE